MRVSHCGLFVNVVIAVLVALVAGLGNCEVGSGKDLRDAPAGWQWEPGWAFFDEDWSRADQSMGGRPYYTICRFTKGDSTLMRFCTGTDWDSTGSPRLRLLDEIRIGSGSDSTDFGKVFGFPCWSGGEVDPWLFGFLGDSRQKKGQPTRLWRANQKTGHIEEISPESILCEPPYVRLDR